MDIRIATHKSELALWQAKHVAAKLEALPAVGTVTLVPLSTRGDELPERLGVRPHDLDRRALRFRHVARRDGHVVERTQVREQGVVLEHEPDAARLRSELGAGIRVEPDVAGTGDPALGRAVEARDAAEHGGLAAPGWTDQREQLAGAAAKLDVQRDRLALP